MNSLEEDEVLGSQNNSEMQMSHPSEPPTTLVNFICCVVFSLVAESRASSLVVQGFHCGCFSYGAQSQ